MKQIIRMMRTAVAGFLLTVVPGFPAHHVIQPSSDAILELTVEKTGLLRGKKHIFTFEKYRGTLAYDQERPESSQVDVTIQSASLVCHDTWVNPKDLRKIQDTALMDMLSAKHYPVMIFRSTSIRKTETNRFEAQGTLTIRELAKPAVIMLSLDAGPGGKLLLRGTSQIRLSDYGLKPPTAILGAIGTKNEMSPRFMVNAVPTEATSEAGMPTLP